MPTPALQRALAWADGQSRHGQLAVGHAGDDDDRDSLLGEILGCVEHALVVPPDALGPELVELARSLAAQLGRRAARREPGRELTPADYLRLVVVPAADAGMIARVELTAWRRALIERPAVEADPRVAAFLTAANIPTPRPATTRARRSSARPVATRSTSRPPRG